MKINRIMLAAPSSGSGKTLITCGLLGLLKSRGMKVASFKCGPDFIDPMFHTRVIGTKSRNLDTFFTDPAATRGLLAKNAAGADIAVMEGVMGYYDGIGIASSRAGASDLASITDTPVLLIVPAKGTSRSILPLIKGFLDFQEKRCIRGIILNRISPMLYPRMKKMIENELHIPVVGYVPVLTGCVLESRHLGLMMPDEIEGLREKLRIISEKLEETLDIEEILRIAGEATEIGDADPTEDFEPPRRPLRIGLADDEAFCFFYEDNLDLLRGWGCELVRFSPIHDREIPDHLDGLLLHGGYPELKAQELSENESMLQSVRKAIEGGLPTMAECGGFLYLHDILTDMQGIDRPMCGIIHERASYTGHLNRFGYMTLSGGKVFGEDCGEIRSHEFHYYESGNPGDAFSAEKPGNGKKWRCCISTDTLFAGFPHLYYYANQKVPKAFLNRCSRRDIS